MVCYSQFPGGGGVHIKGGHRERHWVRLEGRGRERKLWTRTFIMLCAGRYRQGRVSRLKTG